MVAGLQQTQGEEARCHLPKDEGGTRPVGTSLSCTFQYASLVALTLWENIKTQLIIPFIIQKTR